MSAYFYLDMECVFNQMNKNLMHFIYVHLFTGKQDIDYF